MSAVAEPTTVAEPAASTPTTTSVDDLFAQAGADLATRIATPERDTPATPARTPNEEAPAAEASDTSDTPAEDAGRDDRGRFAPTAQRAPEAAPAAKEGEPAAKTEAEPDYRALAEQAARELAAVRGNVQNAAKQAADKARSEAQQEAERNQRETIRRQLSEYEAAGHDVSQARQEWAKSWQAEDDAKRQEAQHGERAGLMLSRLQTDAEQKKLTLYHHGATVLAQDTGLTVDEVRDWWAEADERERLDRASMQAGLARDLPGAAANAEALNDYMATVVTGLHQVAKVKQQYAKQLADANKQIAKLTQELNREETDSPALRPEQPARGGGGRKKDPETWDEAAVELNRRLQTMRS